MEIVDGPSRSLEWVAGKDEQLGMIVACDDARAPSQVDGITETSNRGLARVPLSPGQAAIEVSKLDELLIGPGGGRGPQCESIHVLATRSVTKPLDLGLHELSSCVVEQSRSITFLRRAPRHATVDP